MPAARTKKARRRPRYPRVPHAVKEAWCAALRSGRYRQCWGRLRWSTTRHDVRYCCLGLLAHLLGVRWRKTAWGWETAATG